MQKTCLSRHSLLAGRFAIYFWLSTGLARDYTYIYCIIWGRNAVFVKDLQVGTKINLMGRIQSRVYTKTQENGSVSEHTAYEISVNNFKIEKQSDEAKVEA